MRSAAIAAFGLCAISFAACTPLAQGPMQVSSAPMPAQGSLLYGSAEPVRAPAISHTRPSQTVAAEPPAPVRAADVSARRATGRMNDASPEQGADVVYSEKWYAREKATEERLAATTKICRNC